MPSWRGLLLSLAFGEGGNDCTVAATAFAEAPEASSILLQLFLSLQLERSCTAHLLQRLRFSTLKVSHLLSQGCILKSWLGFVPANGIPGVSAYF